MVPHDGEPDGAFGRLGVVLYRPKSPGNAGSVARAVKNMGFSRLVIADPIAWEQPGYFDEESGRMAWNAADVLQRRVETGTLDEGLAPFGYIVGTTSNPPSTCRVMAPREAASAIAGKLRGDRSLQAALLLGQEDIGLTRDHLAGCNAVISIPSSDHYPSLNISHAALLCLYEIRLALLGPDVSGEGHPPAQPAYERLRAFYGRLEEALVAIDFFQGTGRDHMMREIKSIFNRTLLNERELAILEGVVHRVSWVAGTASRPRSEDQEPPSSAR